jgi:hypothetical protein
VAALPLNKILIAIKNSKGFTSNLARLILYANCASHLLAIKALEYFPHREYLGRSGISESGVLISRIRISGGFSDPRLDNCSGSRVRELGEEITRF